MFYKSDNKFYIFQNGLFFNNSKNLPFGGFYQTLIYGLKFCELKKKIFTSDKFYKSA